MRNELEEEYMAVEGAPVDYGPAICALEREKANIEAAIAELQAKARAGETNAASAEPNRSEEASR